MPVQDGNDKGHWLAGPAQPLEPNVHLHGVARFAIPNYLDSFLQAQKYSSMRCFCMGGVLFGTMINEHVPSGTVINEHSKIFLKISTVLRPAFKRNDTRCVPL